MKQLIIDTNVLISYVTDRDPLQQKKIAGYFEDAFSLKIELVVIENVITEFVSVLSAIYNISNANIKKLLHTFINSPGVLMGDIVPVVNILELWPDEIANYGDAHVAAYARLKNVKVLTFDRKFQNQLTKLGITSVRLN